MDDCNRKQTHHGKVYEKITKKAWTYLPRDVDAKVTIGGTMQ